MSGKRSKTSIIAAIGVMTIFTMQNWSFATAPVLNTMFEYYGGAIAYSTVALISSMQALAMVPGSLIGGAIAGVKAKYKTLTILGMALIVIGGIGPAWCMDSFPLVLVFRFINGFGMGFAFAVGPAMVDMSFEGKARGYMAGIGNAVMGATGMLYSFVAGIMVANVQTYWYMHLIGIVWLILAIIFMREPDQEIVNTRLEAKKALKAAQHSGTIGSKKWVGRVVWVTIAEFLMFMLFYSMLLGYSNVLAAEGIGDVKSASVIMMFYSLGGLAGGFSFGPVYNKLGKWCLPVALILWTAFTGVFCLAKSVPLMCLCFFVTSVGVNWSLPCVPTDMAKYVPPERIALSAGMFNSGMTFGCFLTSIAMGIIAAAFNNTDARLPVICAFVVMVVGTIIWTIIEIRKPADKLGEEVAEDEAHLRATAESMRTKSGNG